MSAPDDRSEFAEMQRRQARALGNDDLLVEQSVDMLAAADTYGYTYLWNWMGVPIIQLPADIMATQEVICATRPDAIIETGVARGGSVLFMASILELLGNGKVVGVDIDIRAHNRDSIERHPMGKRVSLIEGSSIDPAVVAQVKAEIAGASSVMVVLDSDHSRDHVLAELRTYGPMVTEGCYMVAADTTLGRLEGRNPTRSARWPKGDEPSAAVTRFLSETDRFEVDEILNGKMILSSSIGGYLRCRAKA
jgi:cephalosporin hydroxylase